MQGLGLFATRMATQMITQMLSLRKTLYQNILKFLWHGIKMIYSAGFPNVSQMLTQLEQPF